MPEIMAHGVGKFSKRYSFNLNLNFLSRILHIHQNEAEYGFIPSDLLYLCVYAHTIQKSNIFFIVIKIVELINSVTYPTNMKIFISSSLHTM